MVQDAPTPQDEPVFEVAGNRLTLLAEGPQRLEALLALIDGARSSLRLLYYIYAEDRSGQQVRDALLKARERGVTVSLLIDGFGSSAKPAFFRGLEDAGADVCRFLPRFGRRYLLRNHQKLALADERRVIIGGFNVEDDYFGNPDAQAWRDLGLLIDGPAAERLTGYFDALAIWSHTPRARIRELRAALKSWSETEGPVRWLLGGPTRRLSPWALAVKQDMRAGAALDIIAAYFAPNPAMLRRIEEVGRRGRARLIIAAKSDNEATIAASRHCFRRLLKHGVRTFEYQRTKLHTKLFIIDDAVHLGSANFDVRSLYLNLELMLRVEDRRFAERMRAYFDQEAKDSWHVSGADHRARSSLLARLRWGVAYFIVAVLDANVTRRLNFGIDGR